MRAETNPTALACWYDAEVPASSGASASSHSCPENIWILPIVESKLELVQVERQIFLAHIVIGADDAALHQGPKRFDVVRMDVPANVFSPVLWRTTPCGKPSGS